MTQSPPNIGNWRGQPVEDMETAADVIRWQHREIERLRAEIRSLRSP